TVNSNHASAATHGKCLVLRQSLRCISNGSEPLGSERVHCKPQTLWGYQNLATTGTDSGGVAAHHSTIPRTSGAGREPTFTERQGGAGADLRGGTVEAGSRRGDGSYSSTDGRRRSQDSPAGS